MKASEIREKNEKFCFFLKNCFENEKLSDISRRPALSIPNDYWRRVTSSACYGAVQR